MRQASRRGFATVRFVLAPASAQSQYVRDCSTYYLLIVKPPRRRKVSSLGGKSVGRHKSLAGNILRRGKREEKPTTGRQRRPLGIMGADGGPDARPSDVLIRPKTTSRWPPLRK